MSTICFVFLILCAIEATTAKHSLLYNLENADELFEEFIEKYEKQYKDEIEKTNRFEIFLKNLKELNMLNEKYELTQFGINQFTDLTNEEFANKYTGRSKETSDDKCTIPLNISNETTITNSADEKFDWRDKGVVSAVKNQSACGSCWAFSATGNVESVNAIKTGRIIDLSVQQLLDCYSECDGCDGCFAILALGYFIDHGAISEKDYPYESKQGDCRYKADKVAVKIKGCSKFNPITEYDLAEKLRKLAPLSIGIDAMPIRHYKSGIVLDGNCKSSILNHDVLIVGYGKEANGTPYWIFKNSWGSNWGEEGYFRIQRGVNCLGFMGDPAKTAVI